MALITKIHIIMNPIPIYIITAIIYIVFYILLVKKYEIYKSIITKIVMVSLSSLAVGYLGSELINQFTIHILILILLFTTSLIIYTIKLLRSIT